MTTGHFESSQKRKLFYILVIFMRCTYVVGFYCVFCRNNYSSSEIGIGDPIKIHFIITWRVWTNITFNIAMYTAWLWQNSGAEFVDNRLLNQRFLMFLTNGTFSIIFTCIATKPPFCFYITVLTRHTVNNLFSLKTINLYDIKVGVCLFGKKINSKVSTIT